MSPFARSTLRVRGVITALACAWLLAGCASTPKVDWDARVGNYTYDQAVTELGPPDKSTKLTDGSTVADWIKRDGSGFSVGFGTGFSSYRGGVGTGTGVGVGLPVGGHGIKILRLRFGTDGQLVEWFKPEK